MVEPFGEEAPGELPEFHPAELAVRVERRDHGRGAPGERRDAQRRCHRLVQKGDVPLPPVQGLLDAEDRAWAEDDVRQRSVGRDDDRAPDRDHVGGRLTVAAVSRVEHSRELTRWVVPHDRLHLVPELLQGVGLKLRMLDDAAPEGPGVRNDDPDLHPRHYRRRGVRLRSPHDREILRLALPALGALAAEPLYVLVDTAIVGHLGRPELAALGLAGSVLAGAFTIFNFLTYGTTAVVARASGAGQPERAARLAAQALWLSLGIGVALVVVCEAAGGPLLDALGADGRSGELALLYLRIGALGLPGGRTTPTRGGPFAGGPR